MLDLQTNKREYQTSTGIILTKDDQTDLLENWGIKHWGIKKCNFFKTPNNTWLMYIGGKPVAEREGSFEQICYWLDAWAFANDFTPLTGWASIH